MAFSDRWEANDDGSFTDTKDDSGGSDDGGSSSGGSSNPGAGLSGGGGVSDIDDGGGSSGGSSSGSEDDLSFVGDDDEPRVPDEPLTDNDNPFDDGGGSDVPAGNTPSSGNLPSQGGDSTGDGFSDSGGGSDVPAGNTPSSGNLPSQGGDSTGDGFSDSGGGSGGASSGSNPQGSSGEDPAAESVSGDDRAQGGGREFIEDDPSRIPDDPFLSRDTRAGIRGTANDVANTLLGTEEPDQDIQRRLTQSEGLLSDREERAVIEDIEQRKDFFGVGEEAGRVTRDVTGSENAAAFARGLGKAPGEIASATAGATLLLDKTFEGVGNAPEVVADEGAVDTAETVANTVSTTTRDQVSEFRENPIEGSGKLLGELAAGTAASRAVNRGAGASGTSSGGDVDIPDNVRTPDRRPGDPGVSGTGGSSGQSRFQQFLGDEEASLFPDDGGKTITRAEEAQATKVDSPQPAEAELPPREAFSSDQEYARELARARAKAELPEKSEFDTQEAYANELDRVAKDIGDDQAFEARRTAKTQADAEQSVDVDVEQSFDRPRMGGGETTAAGVVAGSAVAEASQDAGLVTGAEQVEAEPVPQPQPPQLDSMTALTQDTDVTTDVPPMTEPDMPEPEITETIQPEDTDTKQPADTDTPAITDTDTPEPTRTKTPGRTPTPDRPRRLRDKPPSSPADEDEDPFTPVDLTGVQSIDAQVETRDVYVDPFEDNG